MAPRRFFVVAAAVALVCATALVISAVGYLLFERSRIHMLGGYRNLTLVRAYLFDPRVRRLAAALQDEEPQTDVLKILWDTNTSALLSRRLFREVDMDGVPKYAYRPDVKKLGVAIDIRGRVWRLSVLDTPRMRAVLGDLNATTLMEASYDAHGFRRVDPALTANCTRRVMFLGDSITDGLWVSDRETFVNAYGTLARAHGGAGVCPVNAGVNGYSSFEERFMLEHEFDAAGRPSVVFVMYFPNDVDNDYDAVVRGTLKDADRLWQVSLSDLRRMHRFAAGHQSTMVLVAVPPFEQVSEHASQAHYQDVLKAFTAKEGITFINAYDDLVQRDVRPLYFDWDPHFTPAGHRVLAEILYERTRDLLK
jgi:lysophospholipase L1-like esterase